MSQSADSRWRIRQADRSELITALGLAFSDVAQSEAKSQCAEIIESVAAGDLTWEGLYVAQASEDSRLVGAIWSQQLPGKVGVVRPPQLLAEAAPQVASLLLDGVTREMQQGGTRYLQSMVIPDDPGAKSLEGAGFQWAADLLFLVRFCEGHANEQTPERSEAPEGSERPEGEGLDSASDDPLRFVPYTPADRDRFERLIEGSYVESLDLPSLDHLREVGDVVDGYLATGQSGDRWWRVIEHQGEEVGCLVVAQHAAQRQCELVYMGILPKYRGRGFGRQVTAEAMRITREAGCDGLVLAVDAANEPALAAYQQEGLCSWDRRSVWLKHMA